MTHEPNPIRRTLAALEPWQRLVLSSLAGAVLLAALILTVTALVTDSEPDTAAAPTTTVPAGAPSTTAAPSSTSQVPVTEATTITTAPTTTTSSSTTTTTLAPAEMLTLRPDGVGDVYFGTEANATIDSLSVALGAPTSDTGWLDPDEVPSTCVGIGIRFVSWGSLQVFLTQGPTDWAPAGTGHFAAYAHSPRVGEPVWDMRTSQGVELGTPVGDVRAIYEGTVLVSDDPLYGPFFEVDVAGAGYLWGELSGVDATDTVTSISGGRSCAE